MWNLLHCTACSQIPVGNACSVIDNGGTCEAETMDHECIERGRLVFECPDMLSSTNTSGSIGSVEQKLSLGDVWGSAHLSTRIAPHTVGNQLRPAQVRILSGSFGIKCRVCGLNAQVLEDRDIRAGRLDVLVEFGPNVLGGVISEQNIAGYGIYLVDGCHRRNSSMLAFVPKAEVAPWPQGMEGFRVDSKCNCPRASYSARVTGQFPPNPVRIMVVPVTGEGYALPVGVTSEILIDYTVATYARLTGSFDLALSSPAAATSFASDPATAAAITSSLASMAGTPLGSVLVSLVVPADVATKFVNTGNQGGRRLQRVMGLVRADFSIVFLEHDTAWSTGTANRYPQAFVFMRQMQESGASTSLARLMERRLQAASGGVNKYGSLQIKRINPCEVEEVPTPNRTSSHKGPMPQHVDEGPWWCRTCRRDPALQIAVASSGALVAGLFLSCAMALLFWCCKHCRRRHANEPQCRTACYCGDGSQGEGSICGQCGYGDRTHDVSFAQTVEFHYYPGVSEGGYEL